MKRFLKFALALALTASPGTVLAQDAPTIPDGSTIKLNNVNNAQVATWGGVYLGPYTGSLQPTGPQFSLYCVDYYHDVTVGQTWQVNSTNLGGTPDLSDTRLGAAGIGDALNRYLESAYLASLFQASLTDVGAMTYDGVNSVADYYSANFGGNGGFTIRNAWSGIHAAIWSITSAAPGVGWPTPTTPFMDAGDGILAQALALPFVQMALSYQSVQGFDGSEWSVLSARTASGTLDTRDASAQEFLVHTTVTPEPSTYALLATGLLFIVGLGRKRIAHIADL
jgi:hypothetical protein